MLTVYPQKVVLKGEVVFRFIERSGCRPIDGRVGTGEVDRGKLKTLHSPAASRSSRPYAMYLPAAVLLKSGIQIRVRPKLASLSQRGREDVTYGESGRWSASLPRCPDELL